MRNVAAGICLVIFTPLMPGVLTAQSASFSQELPTARQTFEGAQTVSSITLTGEVTRISGSERITGSATLVAGADGSSSANLDAGSLSKTETQVTFASGQSCSWSGDDGTVHPSPRHNCMVPVAWFLPEVALFSPQLPSTGSSVLSTNASGQTVLQWATTPASGLDATVTALIAHIGSFELEFDPATNLPLSLSFTRHPDANAGLDIPVKVTFSDYRTINGCSIPFHIQRYTNGVLSEDITVSTATVVD